MVPFAAPGEVVVAKVDKVTSSFARAELSDVLTKSPDRVDPVCPLFSECGGCQYQHLSLDAQRRYKRAQVDDALLRIGGLEGIPAALPPLGTDDAYHYRTKLTPHHNRAWGDDKTSGPYELGPIGFKRRGDSRGILDVTQCAIATLPINAAMADARAAAEVAAVAKATKRADDKRKGQRRKPIGGATLLLRDCQDASGAAIVCTDMRSMVRETLQMPEDLGGAALEYEFQAGEFFQNNRLVLPLMVAHVIREALAAPLGEGSGAPSLVDCYCGSGMFAIAAARTGRFQRVAGVEVSAKAVAAATVNAGLNGVGEMCDFLAGDAESIFDSLPNGDYDGDDTVAILDPPRAGCSVAFLDQLWVLRPRRVVYVSCDVSTQARDAALFDQAGYVLRSVQPIDLFPQTRHIENVCVFDRGDSAGN